MTKIIVTIETSTSPGTNWIIQSNKNNRSDFEVYIERDLLLDKIYMYILYNSKFIFILLLLYINLYVDTYSKLLIKYTILTFYFKL